MTPQKRLVGIALLISVLFVIGSLQWSFSGLTDQAKLVGQLDAHWLGTRSKQVQHPDLNGTSHSLANYRGEVVLLNFWATFCRPCLDELPSLLRLQREYRNRPLTTLAVSQDPAKKTITSFVQSRMPNPIPETLTILWDPENRTAPRFGTQQIPETYVIGKEGKIIARFVSAYDWMRPDIRRLLDSLTDA